MLLILGVIAILVLVYLVLLVVRSGSGSDADRRDADALPPPPTSPDSPDSPEAAEIASGADPAPAAAYGSAGGLRRSFRRARRQLEKHVAGPRPVYGLPWFLVLGAAGSHDPGMWGRAGLSLPFGPPDDEALSLEGCNWWLFDGGVLIDVAGDWVLRGDGRTADEARFGELLAQLQRHRPKKPIDGVVLPIASRDLLDAQRRGHAGLAELEQRADRIYRRLWQTQKQLSIRFPIYLLIVDGQAIPGFHAFTSELPASFDGEIFGWSSPYSVDAAYQDVWVTEALDAIGARLRQVRTQIFGARPGIGDPAGVFLFPRALADLAGPLRVFVRQIFKQSAYHESILCRGIYLCGSGEPAAEAAPSAAARALGGRTRFVRDLLERKVFPEGGLARATAAALVARHRKVRLAQALLLLATLVLGLGVYRTWVRRDHSRDVFFQILRRVAADVADERAGKPPDRIQARASALELFRGMASLDVNAFSAFFLPTSWLSGFDQELEEAMAQAFRGVVFKSLRMEMEFRGHSLTKDDLAATAEAAPSEPVAPERLKQLADLEGFANEVVLYEKEIATFNRLCTFLPAESSRDQLRDLAELVRYLFATELPPEFFESSDLYEDALRRVTYPKITPDGDLWNDVKGRSRARVDALAARFLERLYRGNALVLALARLTTDLDALNRMEAGGPATQEARLRTALAAMNRTEDVLAHPGIAWAFHDEFDLGPRFENLIATIRSSQLLGDDGAQQVYDATLAGWLSFRRALAASESEITGPHLEVEGGKPARALAGEVRVLLAALEDFLDQGFMDAGETQHLLRVPPGHRLVWDTLLLEQAGALYEPFERFRTKGLRPFPSELRSRLERLARTRLGVNMLDLVARAERFEPVPRAITPLLVEPELAAEVDDFAAACDDLQEILGIFERLDQRQARQELSDLVAGQGLRILTGVDGLLTEEQLYLPLGGGFSWWDGQRPLTLRAFGVADPDELEAYLERQRTRIAHLANDYAQPVITTLGKIGIERRTEARAVFGRWEAILAELYAFDNKKPGNSVAGLEELIRSDMARVSLDGCEGARAVRAPRGKPRDYFLERGSRLREGLFARCRQLAFDHALALYARSAAFFNERLAGRFPFAPGVPGELDPAADPDDLRTFLRDFDGYSSYFAHVPESLDDGSVTAVRSFVGRMRAVREFFEAFLTGGAPPAAAGETPAAPSSSAAPAGTAAPPPVPVFDVNVDFRINRDFESGGDQIIGWTLELGDRRIGLRDAQRRGRWELGEPLRLVLRWAQDGLVRPATTAPRRNVEVADREVIFEHRDRWSLLSFVRAHRASRESFRDFVDPQPHTLELDVPTWEADRAEPAAEDAAAEDPAMENGPPPGTELAQARVFVRLSVLAPDSKKPLRVPDFPDRAPPAGPAAGRTAASFEPADDAAPKETPR